MILFVSVCSFTIIQQRSSERVYDEDGRDVSVGSELFHNVQSWLYSMKSEV